MKYAALKAFLTMQRASRLTMTFDEVAAAAKTTLPASAYQYEAWWANNATTHTQANAWLDAGFRTEQVDLEGRRVSFVRAVGVREHREADFGHDALPRHPLLGALRNTFTIEPGFDLTAPALSPEERAEWDANLDRKAAQIAKRRKPA
ncbi:MAG TPA: hypothetical protein VG943_13995 [Caulobacterales bacterium]|nr:hypothetical protein [Caulobacterales bacterium]